MNPNEEDILLAKACQRGQRAAQQFLYQKYAKVCFSILCRYLSDREEAKDMLHDCFLKIFDKIGLYKGNGSLEGWIKRLVVNECISLLRKKKSIKFGEYTDQLSELEFVTSDDTGTTYEADLYTKEDVLQCLQHLQEEYRIVFQLFALDDFAHKEIAEQLGIQENTSRARYFRAKKLIKEHLLSLNSTQK